MADNNYTLGRGELYFARKDPVTGILGGERYLGNTSEFNLSFEAENLEHYSSDRGIRELDKSVILQITRSGSLITDNINTQNVALFFFGSTDALTVAQATVTDEPIAANALGEGIEIGMFYQLGRSANNPTGSRKIIYPGTAGTAFSLKKGSTVLVNGTDYVLNAELGRIEFLAGGAVQDGDKTITATYTVAASTRSRVISGSSPVEGALKFIAYNPVGDNIDYYLPSVTLSPNGDYALKGDEWQQIPFNIQVLKPATGEALYAEGRAVTA